MSSKNLFKNISSGCFLEGGGGEIERTAAV